MPRSKNQSAVLRKSLARRLPGGAPRARMAFEALEQRGMLAAVLGALPSACDMQLPADVPPAVDEAVLVEQPTLIDEFVTAEGGSPTDATELFEGVSLLLFKADPDIEVSIADGEDGSVDGDQSGFVPRCPPYWQWCVLPPPFDAGTLVLTEAQGVDESTVDESGESLAEESPSENSSSGGADDLAVNGSPVDEEPSTGGIDPVWGWCGIPEDGGADVGGCWVDVDWLNPPPTCDGTDLLPIEDQNDDQTVDGGLPEDWGWSLPEARVFVVHDPNWNRAWGFRTLSETAGSDPVTDEAPVQDDTPISADTPILMVCSGMPVAGELRQIPDEPLPPVSLSYVEVVSASVNADLPSTAPAQAVEKFAAYSAVSDPASTAGTSSLPLREAAWAALGSSQSGAESTGVAPLGGRRRGR